MEKIPHGFDFKNKNAPELLRGKEFTTLVLPDGKKINMIDEAFSIVHEESTHSVYQLAGIDAETNMEIIVDFLEVEPHTEGEPMEVIKVVIGSETIYPVIQ